LAWRDILVSYKTTICITWALARPLLIMLVFTLVFSATLCGVRGTQSARSLRHLEMAGRTRLAAHSQETGLEVVIVRPPLVYGPGLKGNFISLLAAIDRGIPLPLAGANNVRSLVYVGNLADTLIACATHPAAVGQTYLVSDGDDVSTAMLVEKIARALGCNSRILFSARPAGCHGCCIGTRAEQVDRLLGSLRVNDEKI
jgi:hypothetical protein